MASLAGVLASLAAARGQELVLTNLTDPAPVNTNAVWDTGNDSNPAIATDGLGNWVCAWMSLNIPGGGVGNDLDILVARSTDGGATWTDPAYLNTNGATDTGHDNWPQVVTDGVGTWVAVWATSENLGGTIGTDLDVVYARSFDNGATWTPAAVLNSTAYTDGTASDSKPHLATDSAGVWICVWESEATVLGTGIDFDIFYAVSTNNGATWAPTRFLNSRAQVDGFAIDLDPRVATDRAGTWLCVWRSQDDLGGQIGNDYDILFAASTNRGSTWSGQAVVNINAGFDVGSDQKPTVLSFGSGRWLVVWISLDSLGGTIGTDSDLLYAWSDDDGGSWSGPAPVNTDAAEDTRFEGGPEVRSDSADHVAVIWNAYDPLGGTLGNDNDIFGAFSLIHLLTWSDPTPVNTTAWTDTTDDRIARTANASGAAWVTVWERTDRQGGPYGSDVDAFDARYGLGLLADLDGDGDVDLSDFTIFQLCFGGSANPPAPPCPSGVDADFDDDGDVDLADFLSFQRNFTGSR